MSGNAPALWVGQRVEIKNLGAGNITYMGEPHFAPGQWVGIVLDMPNGKNDGSVQGRVYIENCPPSHGVFVRPSQVHVLPQPEAAAAVSSVADDDDSLDGSLSPIPSDPYDPPAARVPPSRTPAAPSATTPRAPARAAAAAAAAAASSRTPATVRSSSPLHATPAESALLRHHVQPLPQQLAHALLQLQSRRLPQPLVLLHLESELAHLQPRAQQPQRPDHRAQRHPRRVGRQ